LSNPVHPITWNGNMLGKKKKERKKKKRKGKGKRGK
jgi:hypothetical protein